MSKPTLFIRPRFPDLVLPAFASMGMPSKGAELVNLRELGILRGIGGGEQGYNAVGDVLTRTTDGIDLNNLWVLFQQTLQLQNESRQRIIDFLTFSVTKNIEQVAQAGGGVDFELASEYGEPVGARTKVSYFNMAYDFAWYDIGARFTWMFLAESTAQQVESIHATVLEADNRNIFGKVMRTIFNNTNLTATIQGQPYNVYKFYNNDGTVPPAYKSTTFVGTHNHYLASGSVTLDSGDVEAMEDHLVHHGYTQSLGYRMILMVNKAQADVIRTWRFNVVNQNAAVAKYDFIPARGREDLLFLTQTQVLGVQPAPTIAGLDVVGSYGQFLVVQEDYVPPGYMAAFATGGEANLGNPVGIREHDNAALRGLRLVKGATPDYPLIDSFYQRGFGTGIRQRGGGVVMQVAVGPNYAPPAAYV
jgi:hypothetical protein